MKFVDPLVDQSVGSPSPFHWLAHQSVGAPVSQSLQVRTNELLFFSSKLKETTHVCSIYVGPSNLHFSNKLLKMNIIEEILKSLFCNQSENGNLFEITSCSSVRYLVRL